jgi:Zn-dependent peptidase ImmA (M78 family)/transcriptional regulator with XRE-family HTH domain
VAKASANVNPAVLKWARESVGFDLVDAAKKIGTSPEKLLAAESGRAKLTLRQAEKAADAYERPLAMFFMSEPPVEPSQEAHLRQLPDAPPPPWPPEMVLLTRRIHERQDAANELLELLDETPNWPEFSSRIAAAPVSTLPSVAREMLGISLDEQLSWRDGVGYTALNQWTRGIESVGVLVMQTGGIPLSLMRGFASMSDAVPAIVVNSQDDPRARAYTALHELGHLCLIARGEQPAQVERWCEEFAGDVAAPPSELATRFARAYGSPLARVDALAREFSLTPAAIAVRCRRNELLTQDETNTVLAEIQNRRRFDDDEGGGGNYYTTQIGRVGPSFIRLVFTALANQALTYPSASSLLGVKVNNFDKLREHLDRRERALT